MHFFSNIRTQCEQCVSWNRRNGGAKCLLCCAERRNRRDSLNGNRRRTSDPYAVTFGRILTAEEHLELMGILANKELGRDHLTRSRSLDEDDDEVRQNLTFAESHFQLGIIFWEKRKIDF